MGAAERLVDVQHRAGGQAEAQEAVAQGMPVLVPERAFQLGPQRVAVGQAVAVAGETRVAGQLRLADRGAQLAELPVVAACDEDLARRRLEFLVGCQIRVGLPVACGRRPLRK